MIRLLTAADVEITCECEDEELLTFWPLPGVAISSADSDEDVVVVAP